MKVKDHVLFSSYAGSEVKIDGEEYVILTEDEVLDGILQEVPVSPVLQARLRVIPQLRQRSRIGRLAW